MPIPKEDILLSICIPTYNRAKFLNDNLKALHNQIQGKELPIEIVVSDNCSTDDTEIVVVNFISRGLNIHYIKNSVNLGMDANFAQCYRVAKGKYVFAQGDDDYLIDGMLQKLLSVLESGDYGLIHLHTRASSKLPKKEFIDPEEFLGEISFWITYITSNVVNRKYIENYNFEEYFGTHLTIVPLFLNAALKHRKNLIVYDRIFKDGADTKTNGGYNFFEVFIINYLAIWKKFLKNGRIERNLYLSIKKDVYKNHILKYANRIFVLKVKDNFYFERSLSILFKKYYYHPYFYFYPILFAMKIFLRKIKVFTKLFE